MKKDFTVSSEIYSREKIQEAITDFEEVAGVTFRDNTLSIEMESQDEIDEVFNEFMNYVLSL